MKFMQIHLERQTKGFTLIELLIVIAIIAVLAVVVLLTLNPAELLRQARDSNRVSDLSTLKSAVALFQAEVATSSVNALGTYPNCYVDKSGLALGASMTTCGERFSVFGGTVAVSTTVALTRGISGSGWIPVNFLTIGSGAPISALPVDPTDSISGTTTSTWFFYAYRASSTVYELNANMESLKFKNTGPNDVESTDGGNMDEIFEIGNDPGLDL